MAKKQAYSRYFTGVTYVGVDFVKRVVVDKKTSIRSFAYIVHDKDTHDDGSPKETHIHFLFRTYSSWSCDQICKWFKGVYDEKGIECNTLCEVANDITACYDYLTHECVDGKVVYDPGDIICSCVDDFKSKNDSKDDCYEIINNMLNGMSARELVKRYGRDYVYHKKAYEEVCYDIKLQERWYDNSTQ